MKTTRTVRGHGRREPSPSGFAPAPTHGTRIDRAFRLSTYANARRIQRMAESCAPPVPVCRSWRLHHQARRIQAWDAL